MAEAANNDGGNLSISYSTSESSIKKKDSSSSCSQVINDTIVRAKHI